MGMKRSPAVSALCPQHFLEIECEYVQPGDADHRLQEDRYVGDDYGAFLQHAKGYERSR